jgi:hypothetical protein
VFIVGVYRRGLSSGFIVGVHRRRLDAVFGRRQHSLVVFTRRLFKAIHTFVQNVRRASVNLSKASYDLQLEGL